MYLPGQSSFVASSAGEWSLQGFFLATRTFGTSENVLLPANSCKRDFGGAATVGGGGAWKAQTTVLQPQEPNQTGSWAGVAEVTQFPI